MMYLNYCGQGFVKNLLNYVIVKYEDQYDFFYLFVNDIVLDFYLKFGFECIEESSFIVDVCNLKKKVSKLKKLNFDNKMDFQLISCIVFKRVLFFNILDVKESEDLLMFYVLIVLKNEFYYLEELDVIVLMEQEGIDLYVLDIFSIKKLDVVEVLSYFFIKKIEIIYFFFMLEKSKYIDVVYIIEMEDMLFVCLNVFISENYFLFLVIFYV